MSDVLGGRGQHGSHLGLIEYRAVFTLRFSVVGLEQSSIQLTRTRSDLSINLFSCKLSQFNEGDDWKRMDTSYRYKSRFVFGGYRPTDLQTELFEIRNLPAALGILLGILVCSCGHLRHFNGNKNATKGYRLLSAVYVGLT